MIGTENSLDVSHSSHKNMGMHISHSHPYDEIFILLYSLVPINEITFISSKGQTYMMLNMIFVIVYYIWVILYSGNIVDAKIGINWGRMTSTNLVPSMVVDLLLQNNITEVKLYNINDDVISAFSKTEIGVSLLIPWAETINSSTADLWVKQKVAAFPDVNIKYIFVGNNAFSEARFGKVNFTIIVNALKSMQKSLNKLGYPKVKAVLSHSFTGVLYLNITKPSDADFVPDVKESMLDVLKFLNETNTPFMFDLFPIAYTYGFQVDPNFAFSDNSSTHIIKDINGLVYNNVFDFVHDSFHWAMKKYGYSNIKIVVTQIGWPTDGFPGADIRGAERFWKALLPLVMSNRGTPMCPGAPIDIYMHSLADEKKNPAGLPFARHWGIYRSNGKPKYKIDFTGQGRDVFPTNGKGIKLMPPRWCVLDEKVGLNQDKVKEQFDKACLGADCTSLMPGGSCSMLSRSENVSYAFNAFFQMNFQNEKSCKFEGLGKIVLQDPSRDGCVFQVEVVQGNQQPVTITPWG